MISQETLKQVANLTCFVLYVVSNTIMVNNNFEEYLFRRLLYFPNGFL